VPSYVSKLTIEWGEPRRPYEPTWDFVWRADQSAPEGVAADVAAAADAVGRDVLTSEEVRAQYPGLDWAFRTQDRMLGILSRSSWSELPDTDGADTIARVAELMSDLLTGYEFVQWPMCPSHQHPMKVAVVDDAACWTCPKTAETVCRIGELRA
jgi:hypothetical protein